MLSKTELGRQKRDLRLRAPAAQREEVGHVPKFVEESAPTSALGRELHSTLHLYEREEVEERESC